jgi:hypothetical protein
MKRSTTVFLRGLVFTTAVLAVIAMPGGAFAQEKDSDTGPHWLQVTTVTVRPEKVGDFRNFIKNEYNPAFVKGGGKLSFAWTTAGFGEAFTYYFVSPIEKFADFDGPSPIEKALGADAMGAFYTKAGSLVTSVHTTAMMERQDLTYIGKMTDNPKMAVMIGINVAEGHEADFENFMKNDYLPALKKTEAKGFLAHQTVFGGSQNEYVMLGIIDNFAELDKGHPIARVLGQDGFKKLMQRLPAGSVSESEVNIIRLNEGLSVMPAPPK